MNLNRINIVGAGSLGGFTTLFLSKISAVTGCQIMVWDFDKVEGHNVDNQIYRQEDVGSFKVEALKKIIRFMAGLEIECQNTKVGQNSDLRDGVIVLVDSMASREEIFRAVEYDASVRYYIDARTGEHQALIYAFDPRYKDWVDRYHKTLYKDREEAPVCATAETVPTLWAVASAIAKILVRLKNQKVFRNEYIEVIINYSDGILVKTDIHQAI